MEPFEQYIANRVARGMEYAEREHRAYEHGLALLKGLGLDGLAPLAANITISARTEQNGAYVEVHPDFGTDYDAYLPTGKVIMQIYIPMANKPAARRIVFEQSGVDSWRKNTTVFSWAFHPPDKPMIAGEYWQWVAPGETSWGGDVISLFFYWFVGEGDEVNGCQIERYEKTETHSGLQLACQKEG